MPPISGIIEVGIVDSNERSRRYELALITGSPGMRVVWSCETARAAHACLDRHLPAIVVVALFLGDEPGTELIQELRERWPTVLPLLLIPDEQLWRAVEALEAGACGYLPSRCPAAELIGAIRTVYDGGAILGQPMAKSVVDYFRARGEVLKRLTQREREVLRCLCEGLSQMEIVARFGLSKETVRTHVRHLLEKLDVHSTTGAIAAYLNPNPRTLAQRDDFAEELESGRIRKICAFPSHRVPPQPGLAALAEREKAQLTNCKTYRPSFG